MKLQDLQTPTEAEIDAALARDEEVWHLETGGDDSNDFYIGAQLVVVAEVFARHCPEQSTWPSNWRLDRVDRASWLALIASVRI